MVLVRIWLAPNSTYFG